MAILKNAFSGLASLAYRLASIRRGAVAAEYALIIGLVALAIIASALVFGQEVLVTLFQRAANCIDDPSTC